jgi:hypothetical protein
MHASMASEPLKIRIDPTSYAVFASCSKDFSRLFLGRAVVPAAVPAAPGSLLVQNIDSVKETLVEAKINEAKKKENKSGGQQSGGVKKETTAFYHRLLLENLTKLDILVGLRQAHEKTQRFAGKANILLFRKESQNVEKWMAANISNFFLEHERKSSIAVPVLLLRGAPGVGKTFLVQWFADQFRLNVCRASEDNIHQLTIQMQSKPLFQTKDSLTHDAFRYPGHPTLYVLDSQALTRFRGHVVEFLHAIVTCKVQGTACPLVVCEMDFDHYGPWQKLISSIEHTAAPHVKKKKSKKRKLNDNDHEEEEATKKKKPVQLKNFVTEIVLYPPKASERLKLVELVLQRTLQTLSQDPVRRTALKIQLDENKTLQRLHHRHENLQQLSMYTHILCLEILYQYRSGIFINQGTNQGTQNHEKKQKKPEADEHNRLKLLQNWISSFWGEEDASSIRPVVELYIPKYFTAFDSQLHKQFMQFPRQFEDVYSASAAVNATQTILLRILEHRWRSAQSNTSLLNSFSVVMTTHSDFDSLHYWSGYPHLVLLRAQIQAARCLHQISSLSSLNPENKDAKDPDPLNWKQLLSFSAGGGSNYPKSHLTHLTHPSNDTRPPLQQALHQLYRKKN